MKANERKFIIVLIIITIILGIIVIVRNSKNDENEIIDQEETQNQEYVNILEDGTKLNTSNKLQETKIIDGLEITDIQLTEKENVTVLLATVKNNTEETKGGYPVNIKILDRSGQEIIIIAGYIGEIKAGESLQLNSSATFDYANAYDFEITKK